MYVSKVKNTYIGSARPSVKSPAGLGLFRLSLLTRQLLYSLLRLFVALGRRLFQQLPGFA